MGERVTGEFSAGIIRDAVSDLHKVAHRLTDWERKFVEDMRELIGLYDAIDAFGELSITVKQYNTLITIRDRYL